MRPEPGRATQAIGLVRRVKWELWPMRSGTTMWLMAGERMHVANVYAAAGGEETFRRLVKTFYGRVASDPILRAFYPEEDLSGATERLTLFLIRSEERRVGEECRS